MTTFVDLEDDILYTILAYLYTERRSILQCFGLVCRRLKRFSDSVRFKSIVLEDDPAYGRDSHSYELIDRLTDPLHPSSHYVRDLTVRSFKGDDLSFCMNTELLAKCLVNIQKLDTFSWNSETPLPELLLSTLCQYHPNAQLSTTVQSLDEALLSSPQLDHLIYSVPCLNTIAEETPSLFHALKCTLVQARNLRSLTLNIHYNPDAYRLPGTRTDRLQLPLSPEDRLPPLEDLAITATTYAFDEPHCTLWRECMGWNKLKRLVLHAANPAAFFTAFTGALPALEDLDISLHYPGQDFSAQRGEHALDVVPLRDFMASLRTLRALVVRCNLVTLDAHFWHCVLTVHRGLRRLAIRARHDGLGPPEILGKFKKVLQRRLVGLRELELAVRCGVNSTSCKEDCVSWGYDDHYLETEYTHIVPEIPTLRSISLSLESYWNDACPFYQSVEKHAHCALKRLWVRHRLGELETIGLRFWRWRLSSPHRDNMGLIRGARIEEVFFDSWRNNSPLCDFTVKVRHHREIPQVRFVQTGTSRECEFHKAVLGHLDAR